MLFKMGLTVLLVGVLALQVLGLGTTENPQNGPASSKTTHRQCRGVLQHFVKHKIGHRSLTSETKTHGMCLKIPEKKVQKCLFWSFEKCSALHQKFSVRVEMYMEYTQWAQQSCVVVYTVGAQYTCNDMIMIKG